MSTNENKTISYNGMELECIESGYWPDGVTLVCSDNGKDFRVINFAVILRNGRSLSENGVPSAHWRHWAILPPKPAQRRLTNRELAGLARKEYDVLWLDRVCPFHDYDKCSENDQCSENVKGVRAPNSDEWLEPTIALLEK